MHAKHVRNPFFSIHFNVFFFFSLKCFPFQMLWVERKTFSPIPFLMILLLVGPSYLFVRLRFIFFIFFFCQCFCQNISCNGWIEVFFLCLAYWKDVIVDNYQHSVSFRFGKACHDHANFKNKIWFSWISHADELLFFYSYKMCTCHFFP